VRDVVDVHRLAAVHEIRQLAYRYAYAVDFRDVAMYRGLWAPSDPPAEPPEIDVHAAEQMIKEWPSRGPSILFVCNHLIDFDDDDHAHGSVYCLVQVGWGERFIDQSVMYQDRYVRDGGRWLFRTRRHLMWFGEDRSRHPFRMPSANWPASPTGRGSLPEDIESYRRFRAALDQHPSDLSSAW
jgi:hypothetical protein